MPYRIEKIEDNAFAECVKLATVTIPRATTSIADNAFSYPDRMTIYGVAGTTAETYASSKGIKFVSQNVPAESIELNKTELTLLRGQSESISADIKPMNFTDEVVWKSSNAEVATVDNVGKITAVGTGDTTVKLVVGDQAAVVNVHVLQPASSVFVSPYSVELEGDETVQLAAEVRPDDANDKTVEWSSSDESIAKVDQAGKVTALKKGEARITATAKDGSGRSGSANIIVTCNVVKATTVDQLESQHPYEKNCNDVWTYSVAGAKSLEVAFDSRTKVEDGTDYIRIYAGDKSLVGAYTGSALAGKTVNVTGDTVRIKLESDEALNDWGFKVASVKAVNADESSTSDDPGTVRDPNSDSGSSAGEGDVKEGRDSGKDVEGEDNYNSEARLGSGSDSGSGADDDSRSGQGTDSSSGIINDPASSSGTTVDQGIDSNGTASGAGANQTSDALTSVSGVTAGETVAATDGTIYQVTTNGDGAAATATYQSPKSPKKKSPKVPAKVTLNGKVYNITGIAKGAFKNSKAKTVTIVSKLLTKKSVKNCFKGSKVRVVKVPKSKLKAYKKIFTKKNCGAKVKVRAK